MSNYEELINAIHSAYDALLIREAELLRERHLTVEQYRVISTVKSLPAPVRVTDIARSLNRSVNSVSMIVDRMLKESLLSRTRGTKDRRVVYVRTTAKAENLYSSASSVMRAFEAQLTASIGGRKQGLILSLEAVRVALIVH